MLENTNRIHRMNLQEILPELPDVDTIESYDMISILNLARLRKYTEQLGTVKVPSGSAHSHLLTFRISQGQLYICKSKAVM